MNIKTHARFHHFNARGLFTYSVYVFMDIYDIWSTGKDAV